MSDIPMIIMKKKIHICKVSSEMEFLLRIDKMHDFLSLFLTLLEGNKLEFT